MEKKVLKYLLISLCLVSSVLLVGCANNKIQFNRESKVSELMNNLNINNSNKSKINKSSGMIIYRDTSSSSSSSSSMNFGPRDINFDMPMRMK